MYYLPQWEEEGDVNHQDEAGDGEQEAQAMKILRQTYWHDLVDHRDVFAAIVVITQIAITKGEPLFAVEYND